MKKTSEETKAGGGGTFLRLNCANGAAGSLKETSSVWVENSRGLFLPASRVSLSDTNNDSLERDSDDREVALPTIKSGMSSSDQ